MGDLKVGIIAHTTTQQHHLHKIIRDCGGDISVSLLIENVLDNNDLLVGTDALSTKVWLVDIDTSSIDSSVDVSFFDNWLYESDHTVIFGEGITHDQVDEKHASWVRQVKRKLSDVLRLNEGVVSPKDIATYVWVLSASTGGPEAVKEFVDNIPSGLGVGFIYVQHIGAGQDEALVKTIARDSSFSASSIKTGCKILADSIMVVPADKQFTINDNGTMLMHDSSWRGIYQPSINQVVAMVAKTFGDKSGAIFFTGLGDDGLDGARLMFKTGGCIFVQSPVSCVSASMPEVILESGVVKRTGTPKELAAIFLETIQKKTMNNKYRRLRSTI